MRRIHAHVFARSPEATRGVDALIEGKRSATLTVSQAGVVTPFAVDFEQAFAALANLPRMFIEPDGAFVWVGRHQQQAWQLDGNLFDHDGRIVRVDLIGTCPADSFQTWKLLLGSATQPLMFQLLPSGWLVDEAAFAELFWD